MRRPLAAKRQLDVRSFDWPSAKKSVAQFRLPLKKVPNAFSSSYGLFGCFCIYSEPKGPKVTIESDVVLCTIQI